MPIADLKYPLCDGYVHNWLVAGPRATPVSATPTPNDWDGSALSLVQRYFELESGMTVPPVELGPLSPARDELVETWRYYRCDADHFVDFTDAYPVVCHVRAWAFARVRIASEQAVSLVLTSNGPADIWLNGQHLLRHEHLSQPLPHSVTIAAALKPGDNDLLIRFENIATRETATVMALRVDGLVDAGPEIVLPADIEPGLLEKRLELEHVIESAVLDRYVYGWFSGDRYNQNEPITVQFPPSLKSSAEITFRVQSLDGHIFQERTQLCQRGTTVPMARTFPLWNGPHELALLPPAHEYYNKRLRIERRELFHVVRTAYSQPAGRNAAQRAQAALEDAAQRRGGSLYCEIAKMVLDRWEKVDMHVLQRAVERIRQRHEGSVTDMLGLLSSRQRFKTRKHYLEPIRPAFETAIVSYRFWNDAPGAGFVSDAIVTSSESQQILYHTCEILAGQRLPDRVFQCTGKTGRWHRERGENLALAWMRQQGLYGFREWHSPAGVEVVVAALTCLVDLAANPAVAELASVLLDKLFFGLAVNSHQGAYGSTRGRTDTASVLSSRLEATSGLAWLLWGQGNLNESVMGTVSLAGCQNYALPEVIGQLAQDPAEALWSQERHVRPAEPAPEAVGASDQAENAATWAWEANTVTYRTRDFMLSCAQDYRPGQPGRREHIWQATLGPDAIVFVNHPTSLSVDEARQPNAWAGNGVLPRAAQWGDVLIALYQLPENDWLGCTHAYFPSAAFDEYVIDDAWAFARQGEGYLALRAARSFAFITAGPTAYRELRSPGQSNIWLCQMGLALLDGSFEDFQRKVRALDVVFHDLSVRLRSLRGEQLAFGWTGPLLVDGQPQALAGAWHIDNPYCRVTLPATQLDIVRHGEGIRLKFD